MKDRSHKTLTVDCDGTLFTTAYPAIGKQLFIHKIVLAYAKHLQKRGWYVTLQTCRENKTLLEAIIWCNKHDFYPDGYNQNNPIGIEKYGDCRKVSGTLMIDDHNIGLLGFILRLVDRIYNWRR